MQTYFIGGNNEILEINAYSPQTKDIFFDKEEMKYIITFNNIKKEAEFYIKGKFKNKCEGNWHLELTDKDFEDDISEVDKMCKPQLKKIAEEIIHFYNLR